MTAGISRPVSGSCPHMVIVSQQNIAWNIFLFPPGWALAGGSVLRDIDLDGVESILAP